MVSGVFFDRQEQCGKNLGAIYLAITLYEQITLVLLSHHQ